MSIYYLAQWIQKRIPKLPILNFYKLKKYQTNKQNLQIIGPKYCEYSDSYVVLEMVVGFSEKGKYVHT